MPGTAGTLAAFVGAGRFLIGFRRRPAFAIGEEFWVEVGFGVKVESLATTGHDGMKVVRQDGPGLGEA